MSLEQDLKDAIDGIGRNFEEFKAENNKLIAKGVKDALAEAKLDKLGQSIDDLTGKKEDLEKRLKQETADREELERKFNLLRLGGNKSDEVEQKFIGDFNLQVKSLARERGESQPAEVDAEGFRAYKSAWVKLQRKGRDSLSSDEIKAMTIGSDADGGFLVPSDTSGRIITKLYDLSPIRQIATVQTISSDRLEGIEDTDEASGGWVGETGTRSDTDTPKIGKYEIVAQEMYSQPKASQRLLDDASVDIESWLSMKVADKFARLEGAAFVAGSGISQPRGFVSGYTYVATGDSTRSWGQLEMTKTGVNGDFAASTPADILFTLIGLFKPAYLAGASWVTRREVIAKIRKFKESTTNAYIWQPGLQAGQPAQILGYPIVMAEDMPALSANGVSLALGDFKAGYQIVDRLGVRTLRDPFTDKPYVKFYTTKRTGGGVVNFEAIKGVQFST